MDKGFDFYQGCCCCIAALISVGPCYVYASQTKDDKFHPFTTQESVGRKILVAEQASKYQVPQEVIVLPSFAKVEMDMKTMCCTQVLNS